VREAGSNAETVSAPHMIHQNPSDEVLRSAHRISLFDPSRPGFHSSEVDQIPAGLHTGKHYQVVDIPVDSTNFDTLKRWRDRIREARRNES
jgi:hypothetical protein